MDGADIPASGLWPSPLQAAGSKRTLLDSDDPSPPITVDPAAVAIGTEHINAQLLPEGAPGGATAPAIIRKRTSVSGAKD